MANNISRETPIQVTQLWTNRHRRDLGDRQHSQLSCLRPRSQTHRRYQLTLSHRGAEVVLVCRVIWSWYSGPSYTEKSHARATNAESLRFTYLKASATIKSQCVCRSTGLVVSSWSTEVSINDDVLRWTKSVWQITGEATLISSAAFYTLMSMYAPSWLVDCWTHIHWYNHSPPLVMWSVPHAHKSVVCWDFTALASPAMGHWGTCPPRLTTI